MVASRVGSWSETSGRVGSWSGRGRVESWSGRVVVKSGRGRRRRVGMDHILFHIVVVFTTLDFCDRIFRNVLAFEFCDGVQTTL